MLGVSMVNTVTIIQLFRGFCVYLNTLLFKRRVLITCCPIQLQSPCTNQAVCSTDIIPTQIDSFWVFFPLPYPVIVKIGPIREWCRGT